MIINCINCNKKFEIKDELIPKNGRLLQCGVCNHQWFFKKEIFSNTTQSLKSETIKNSNNIKVENKENLSSQETDEDKQIFFNTDIESNKNKDFKNKEIIKNGNYNIFNITVVFIISFIAIIILIDTFINPISKMIPNAKIILYNLYESIKDIILFFKDLI